MRHWFRKRTHVFLPRGFTLVEMLVVLGIFFTVSSLVLVRERRFHSDTHATNVAYTLALIMREAQVSSLGSREVGSSGLFTAGRGIRFDVLEPNSFFLYVDINNNERWDNGDVKLATHIFADDTSLRDVCAVGQTQSNCMMTGSISSRITHLDIVFLRPNPEPSIRTSCIFSCANPFAHADITVVSPNNISRLIRISSTGQISIQ